MPGKAGDPPKPSEPGMTDNWTASSDAGAEAGNGVVAAAEMAAAEKSRRIQRLR
jgi:hypothetical protein